MKATTLCFSAGLILMQALVSSEAAAPTGPTDVAGRAITADGILAHIKILASDEFDGRLPGTRGADLTVAYFTGEFKSSDLRLAIRMAATCRPWRSCPRSRLPIPT